jgi:hypothetical protein
MLLGFVVFERSIEANTEKTSAITDMGTIQNLKGVSELRAVSRLLAAS